MKISSVALPASPAAASAAAPAAPAVADTRLESAVLQPAQAALRALPDFDAARVAELRDALARGELPFDAGRLAGLIQRFHGKG
jgi:negative regulator of flagellin synthesis FlgM